MKLERGWNLEQHHVKHAFFKSAFGVFVALLATQCSAVEYTDSLDLGLWSRVVTAEFFRSVGGPGDYAVGTSEGIGLAYAFIFHPPPDNPKRVLSISVVVAPGGALLDPAMYERVLAATPQDERVRDFPTLGARALMTPPLFGPGGSSFGVLSTTKDKRYDLRVTLLDGGADSDLVVQSIDPVDISVRLHEAYESMAVRT